MNDFHLQGQIRTVLHVLLNKICTVVLKGSKYNSHFRLPFYFCLDSFKVFAWKDNDVSVFSITRSPVL